MLSNFMFSVNSVVPVFLVLALGWFIRRKRFLSNGTIEEMNNLVFTFALPLMLFRDISRSDFNTYFDPELLVWAVFATCLMFVLSWVFAEIFIKDKASIGAFVQGSFRSNYAIIGLSLVANILGDSNTGKGALITTFIIPIYAVLSVVVLSFRSSQSGGSASAIKSAAVNVCKNPMIIAIVIALPFSFFGIKLPGFITSGINYMASLTTPLALIAIGGTMSVGNARKNMGWAAIATAVKLVITPLIFVPLSVIFLDMRGEDLVVLYIMFASPTSISSYVMASKMKSNPELAANIILLTTLLSVFAYTAGIYILKTLAFI